MSNATYSGRAGSEIIYRGSASGLSTIELDPNTNPYSTSYSNPYPSPSHNMRDCDAASDDASGSSAISSRSSSGGVGGGGIIGNPKRRASDIPNMILLIVLCMCTGIMRRCVLADG
jgi:hypothetical protein